MDEPVTVRDVMNRTYVGVSEADTVAGAARLMREEGMHSAVVLRGSEPVGLLDEDLLLELVAESHDSAELTAGEVMRGPAVAVDVDQRLDDAISAMATDAIRHLLVESDGALVGTLSDHDIVTAHSVLERRTEPAETMVAAPIPPDEEVEVDFERDVYSSQGVCENCGALTRELSSHNGQLVCADCLAL